MGIVKKEIVTVAVDHWRTTTPAKQLRHIRILGLDPGTATTGYGLVDLDGAEPIVANYGCILTDKSVPAAERLVAIHEELTLLVQATKPDHVMIERLFFSNNQKTAMAVSEARGVILMTLSQLSVPSTELTPPQVKQRVVGNGRADKRMVQRAVTEILALDERPKPDDAADALALAICGLWIHLGLVEGNPGEETKKLPAALIAMQLRLAEAA